VIRPVGPRIAVKPDRRPETTESGFIIPQSAYVEPPMSGVVIAVGDWPATLRRVYARAVKDAIDCVNGHPDAGRWSTRYDVAEDLGKLLMEAPNPEHHVNVGDRVLFPMEAGHEIILNEDTDDAIVILNEDSVLAVLAVEESAA
jgi:co-chaperonin GroES (HSP10)